ncbi:MAG TPA: hypothetical protein VNF29_08070 [Candidatus Binataceae bacterium]|nr:hypothetical protein [Candidatus Binataceae bacterium]
MSNLRMIVTSLVSTKPGAAVLSLAAILIVCSSNLVQAKEPGIFQAKEPGIPASTVKEGFLISPIPMSELNLKGKNHDLVGLGSYLVNGVADCSGCHSFPEFLPDSSLPDNGDPFTGTPADQSISGPLSAHYNAAHYLAGGQCFGPFMARDITPDASGLPAGLTLADFITVMRTGADVECKNDPSDPICAVEPPTPVLQVMPWATFHNMTDRDLSAIYTYLTAIPSPDPCNTPADGCPGFSGRAKNSQAYVYANTADCPNPAPPQ